MSRPLKKQKNNLLRPRQETADEVLKSSRAAEHYQISDETRNPLRVKVFLSEHEDDPATKVGSHIQTSESG